MNQCTSLSYSNHFQTCFSKLYCLFQKLDMFVFCTHKNFLLNGNNNFLRTYWNVIIWFRRRKVLIKLKEKWFNIKEILPYTIIKSRMFAVWYAIKLQVLTELRRISQYFQMWENQMKKHYNIYETTSTTIRYEFVNLVYLAKSVSLKT